MIRGGTEEITRYQFSTLHGVRLLFRAAIIYINHDRNACSISYFRQMMSKTIRVTFDSMAVYNADGLGIFFKKIGKLEKMMTTMIMIHLATSMLCTPLWSVVKLGHWKGSLSLLYQRYLTYCGPNVAIHYKQVQNRRVAEKLNVNLRDDQ